jgi:hypothetical protein
MLEAIAADFSLASVADWGVYDANQRTWLATFGAIDRLAPGDLQSFAAKGLVLATPTTLFFLTDEDELSPDVACEISQKLQEFAMDELHRPFPELVSHGIAQVLEPAVRAQVPATLIWTHGGLEVCEVGALGRTLRGA